MQLLLSPGDRVVAVTPLWPNLVEIPVILSAGVTRVPLIVEGGRWQLNTDRLIAALTPGTRLLLLNSPNNPTGWTITEPELRRVFEHCNRLGIWILGDDVYERLAFRAGEKSAPSLLRLAEAGDRVISVNSFSKAWRMTGWRAGWLVVPPALLDDLGKIIEFNTSCLPEFVQRAGTVALRDGEDSVVALRAEMSHASAHLREALTSLPGVDLPLAEGAMYAFFRLEGQTDSLALAKDLIHKVGLGLAPGIAFGPEGEAWLRWCFANHTAKLDDGIARLRRYLGED
jgi:aspartate/methionine/tyrosine aminotransferase